MKYSISNIAWDKKDDVEVYKFLQDNKIDGVEIAPTRLFENPYENLEISWQYAQMLQHKYNLKISSMQSIWYGISQNIFAGDADRIFLLAHTKKAIDFAQSMGIKNLVFGCPKNRNIQEGNTSAVAKDFFKELGDYAICHDTILALEPNPTIYGTNFLNTTKEACEFCLEVASGGLRVNADFGTILQNGENPHIIKTYKNIINHIHLSVPNLEYVEKAPAHETLKKVLEKIDYQGYLSIEMKNQNDIEKVKKAVAYLKENF